MVLLFSYIVLFSRSQNVIWNKSGKKQGTNIKYLHYVFIEQGVAMLVTILN